MRGESGGLLEFGQVQPQQQLRAHEWPLEVKHLARLGQRVHLEAQRVGAQLQRHLLLLAQPVRLELLDALEAERAAVTRRLGVGLRRERTKQPDKLLELKHAAPVLVRLLEEVRARVRVGVGIKARVRVRVMAACSKRSSTRSKARCSPHSSGSISPGHMRPVAASVRVGL